MTSNRHWRIQSEPSECGLACVAICSSILGSDIPMGELRGKYGNSQRGLGLNQIISIASTLDMQSRAVRCEVEDLVHLHTPAILHWKLNHFVVLERARRGKFNIIDPSIGSVTINQEELSKSFTGVALEVKAAPSFQPRKQRSPLSIWSMIRFRDGVGTALLHTLFYSLLLQGFVLLSPFFVQLSIDEGIARGDHDFLLILAVGFTVVALFNSLAEAIRGIAVQKVSALMGWDMSRRLFHRMISLPLAWFHRRRLADALSRLESIEPIRQLISNGLISAILDGVLSIGIIIFMFIYSPLMTGIALGAIVIYAIVRVSSTPVLMKVGMERLQASIAERGTRIETLRAMQSIKTMGGESSRESLWANKYAALVKATLNSNNYQGFLGAANSLVDGVAIVAVVFIGGKSVLNGVLSVGSLYAFIAYRQQLSNRMTSLIDQCISWRLTEIHTDRLADVVLTPSEEGYNKDPSKADLLVGHIQLKAVSMRYAAQDQAVLRDINLTIKPGEFVAITGPSGCGKSTLVKILAGLYTPTTGEVHYDNMHILNWGARVVRQRMGVVMQDDELLMGSILDNVTFFSEDPDVAKAWQCLEMSAIAEDVRRFPMQMETLIGDMGASLSGGQKQRLLLARALYRKPAILILDEATANLDVAKEAAIHSALEKLSITRILITHRPETMKLASRLIKMADGKIISDVKNPLPNEKSSITHDGVLPQSADQRASPAVTVFPVSSQL